MKTKIMISGIVVALIAGTTMKLLSNKQTVEKNIFHRDREMKILVQANTVTQKDFQKSFTYTGTFSPFKEVLIIPQMHGEVKNVYFNEGDMVVKGQALVQMDDDLLQAQYSAAAVNHETSKRSLDRYQSASEAGAVSQLQLDNLHLSYKTAEAQVKQLLKQIDLSRLEAPFTGTITLKDVEVGSVIGNAPVARVTDLSQMKLEIFVPEKEVGMFSERSAVLITTDVFQGKQFKGIVTYVADRADNAHNYLVKITIDNNDSAARLKAGMYGKASITRSLNQQVLTIPRAALLGSAKNPQVFVIEGDKATLRSIQAGSTNGDHIEVLSGLVAGDVVVTGGQINLTEGTRVEIAK